MKQPLKSSMFAYYTERAPEFDQIYLGGGPASVSDPEPYRAEVEVLAAVVKRVCAGSLIDMGCGTAFWLPQYADTCNQIVLVDQSEEMLTRARQRASSAGVADKTAVLLGDVLVHEFADAKFDTALAAFLVSHFTAEQEVTFFRLVKSLLRPGGQLLLLDSVWNQERARTREKEGTQVRSLEDGRQFQIYKKYFDESGLSSMEELHGIDLTLEHFGKVFLAATITTKEDNNTIDPYR